MNIRIALVVLTSTPVDLITRTILMSAPRTDTIVRHFGAKLTPIRASVLPHPVVLASIPMGLTLIQAILMSAVGTDKIVQHLGARFTPLRTYICIARIILTFTPMCLSAVVSIGWCVYRLLGLSLDVCVCRLLRCVSVVMFVGC